MRSWPLLRVPLGSFLVIGGIAMPASAEPTLEWLAPSSCPNAEAVHRRIELQLGHTLDEHPASVRYAASITGGERAPWQLQLRIERDGASHTRELEAATCAALAEAAAVLVVLSLRPSEDPQPFIAGATGSAGARVETGHGSPPFSASGRAPADSSDEPELSRELSPRGESSKVEAAPGSVVRGELGVGGGIDLNGLPDAALSTRVGLAMAWDGGYAVEGRFVLEPEQHFSLPNGASMDARVIAGAALGCLGGEWSRRVSSRLCLGAEVGSLGVAGYSAAGLTRTSVRWGGPVGTLGVTWSFSDRFGVEASLLGLMPMARHAFRFDGLGEAHRLPLAAVRLEAGLIAHLWH